MLENLYDEGGIPSFFATEPPAVEYTNDPTNTSTNVLRYLGSGVFGRPSSSTGGKDIERGKDTRDDETQHLDRWMMSRANPISREV